MNQLTLLLLYSLRLSSLLKTKFYSIPSIHIEVSLYAKKRKINEDSRGNIELVKRKAVIKRTLIKSDSGRYYLQYKACYVLILHREIILYFTVIYITEVGPIIHTQLLKCAKFPATATFDGIVLHAGKIKKNFE